jgi:hypothetical protein
MAPFEVKFIQSSSSPPMPDRDDAPPNAKNLALGAGCLMLFALPFAVAGMAVCVWALRDAWVWSEAQHWVETPARLLSAELETRPGEDGGRVYQAHAQYRYEFAGRDYESRRVAVTGGSDNVGTYQQDRAEELIKLHRAGKPTVCYVDPDNPAEAVLFRDFRSGIFALKLGAGLLFGGVGWLLIIGGWIGYRKARREAVRSAAHPDEPWRWRDDWLAGRLRCSSRTKAWVMTGMALFWNAISWPAFVGAMMQDDIHWGAKLIVALFPLIGAGLAFFALKYWLQYWRWGASEFEMAAIPGVLGGPLAGVIHAPGGIEPSQGFVLRLACVRKVKNGKHTRDVTLWEQEKVIQRRLDAGDGRTLIPVQFIIPYDLPPSEGSVAWKLSATAEVNGADYHAEFQPPVFRTAASSSKPIAAADPHSALYAPPPDFATFIARLGAELEEDFPDRRTLYFPMMRNRGLAATMVAITVVLFAISIGLYFSPAPRLFFWSSGLTGVVMAIISFNSILERTRLTFGQRGLVVENSILRTTRTSLPPEHVKSIDVIPTGTSVGSTSYQKVIARELGKHDGSTITLANEIPRREDAERLAEEIRAAISPTSPHAQRRKNAPAANASPSMIEDELPDEFR